ncbi:MAG: 2-oxo acid dehydrogenase subunit E2, partial [Actinobacteria bacterium]|nr:2-oxo acid dehydrogenase subunit E2 [Actinomycetota bacterium]
MADIRDFLLPDLGEGLEEGEIVSWAVEVGERITLNQTVAEIETAKAVVAVPSPFAGVVKERHGEVGDVREVGKPLITIEVEKVAKDADVDDVAGQTGGSPAQGAMEATPTEAAASAPSSEGRKSTGLDADEEPQPLVGYGQGGGGGRRRRRGKAQEEAVAQPAAASGTGTDAKPLAKPPVRK